MLVAVARGETPVVDPVVAAAPAEFVEAVRFHRLAPLAHVLLRVSDPALAQLLKEDRDRALGTHLHMTTLLGHLGSVLDGIPWVVFKGPVLSETAHPVAGLRSYRDLDLLVDPADLRSVTTRLHDAGWTIADFDDMLRNPKTPGEMHWRSPSGALMDLHWAMVNTADRRRRLAVPTTRLLERRVPVQLGFNSAWTLDPEDSLIHVCLHAALTGANKLLYLVDAQQLAALVTDWSEVGRRAVSWGAAPHVSLVLRRARAALGGQEPPELRRALDESAAFRALTAAVDRMAPVSRARADPGIARLVARAVRPGAGATVASASRSAVRYLGGREQGAPVDRAPAGDDALTVYLARVEATLRASP